QHLEDVVLLNTRRGSWTVRNDIINNQAETFREAELFAHNPRNVGSFDAKKCDWHFFLMAVALIAGTDRTIRWCAGRGRRNRRIRRRLGESSNRQKHDRGDG